VYLGDREGQITPQYGYTDTRFRDNLQFLQAHASVITYFRHIFKITILRISCNLTLKLEEIYSDFSNSL
jgi:hypothetical protein